MLPVLMSPVQLRYIDTTPQMNNFMLFISLRNIYTILGRLGNQTKFFANVEVRVNNVSVLNAKSNQGS